MPVFISVTAEFEEVLSVVLYLRHSKLMEEHTNTGCLTDMQLTSWYFSACLFWFHVCLTDGVKNVT